RRPGPRRALRPSPRPSPPRPRSSPPPPPAPQPRRTDTSPSSSSPGEPPGLPRPPPPARRPPPAAFWPCPQWAGARGPRPRPRPLPRPVARQSVRGRVEAPGGERRAVRSWGEGHLGGTVERGGHTHAHTPPSAWPAPRPPLGASALRPPPPDGALTPPGLGRCRGSGVPKNSPPPLPRPGALDDFDKARPPPPPPGPAAAAPAQPRSPADTAKDALFASQEKFFQELFDGELASQATAEFERAMEELAREEPHLVRQFQKLSEAAGRVGSDASSQQEFTACLKETLSGLAKNATDLQASGVSEEELARAVEGLGLGLGPDEGGGDEGGGVLPVMQSLMQSLLSRDVLYPSLRDITDKYPEWLRIHGPALGADQLQRYRQQHHIMERICQQFEAEAPGDGPAQRTARFEAVLDLMQQLQDLGHPPKELAGESPPGFNFDLDALNPAGLAGASGEQCLIM
uniref:Peroxisomal biogenesis factor 19 n=1 Tax=Ornithorhynchus anatinus TaxID=9258 RepID=F6SHD7_ORNAN